MKVRLTFASTKARRRDQLVNHQIRKFESLRQKYDTQKMTTQLDRSEEFRK